MKKRGTVLYEGMLASIAMKRETDGLKRPVNDGGRLQALDDFYATYLPNEDSKKTWELD
jgi:hypothetical protein